MLNLMVVAIFLFAVCASLYLLYRRGDLERFASLPGETLICEERDVGIDEKRIRFYRYGHCLVRLTDRRIVIAQKVPLFKDAYYVRFVIEYGTSEPGIDIGGMLLKGYVPAHAAPSQVNLAPDGASVSVTVSLLHANGNRYSELTYRSEHAGEYTRTFLA
jgi:hypothetical protein